MQNATWTRLASYGALLLLTVACSLFGCVSKNADAGDVIERSAELKPAWAEGDVSLAGTAEVFLLHRKSDVTRLELGIKQAQSTGMDQSCAKMQERMRVEIEKHAQEAGLSTPALGAAVAGALPRVQAEGRCPDVAPKFVYWELLRKDTAEGSRQSYDVYVLISLKRRQYLEALGVVLEALKASDAPGAKALADKVSESYNESQPEE